MSVGATPPSSRPAANAVAPFAARTGSVEKPRRCAAMNEPGTPGTSATGARSTSTPRRLERGRRLAPAPADRALGEPPELLGRGNRRRPAEAPHETALLVGRDQDTTAARSGRPLAGSPSAPAPGAPCGRSRPSGSRRRPAPCESARVGRRSASCRSCRRRAAHRRARRAAREPRRPLRRRLPTRGDGEREESERAGTAGNRRSETRRLRDDVLLVLANGERKPPVVVCLAVDRQPPLVRPGSSRSGPELIATGKSSGVPGLRPAGRPTSNGTSSKKTIGSLPSPVSASISTGMPVGVEQLESHHVTLVRLVPRDADQDRDPERRGLRPGQRPAAADDRELAVAHLGEVGQQHRHAHDASLAQGDAEVSRTAGGSDRGGAAGPPRSAEGDSALTVTRGSTAKGKSVSIATASAGSRGRPCSSRDRASGR